MEYICYNDDYNDDLPRLNYIQIRTHEKKKAFV